MIKINIVTVGNLKEKYLIDCVNEYVKRIGRFATITITELEEEKLPKNFSEADISKCLVRESLKIEKHLQGFVIIMDVNGSAINSNDFAKKIKNISLNYDTITFVIGSSYGICQSLKPKANMLLSFSKMTFPHQVFRVMLLEQIYRACTINNNIQYHK